MRALTRWTRDAARDCTRAIRFGHSSVSTSRPARGRKRSRNASTANGRSYGSQACSDAIAVERAAGLPPGSGHRREHDASCRGCSRAMRSISGAAARVSPSETACTQSTSPPKRRRLVAIAPEPLADRRAVARLAPPAPPQPQRQPRQREPPQQRVQVREPFSNAAKRATARPPLPAPRPASARGRGRRDRVRADRRSQRRRQQDRSR